jgi:hypothetical protein
MTGLFRNRLFLEGIVLGGVCGIVIGSIIAYLEGDDGVTAARRFVNRLVFRQPQQVQFELLLQ